MGIASAPKNIFFSLLKTFLVAVSFFFITGNNYKITLYISLSGGIVHHQRSCSLTHLLLSAAPHCFSSTSNLSSNFFYAACLSHAEFFFATAIINCPNSALTLWQRCNLAMSVRNLVIVLTQLTF